jgi:RHS repeat-associated protein
VVSAWTYDAAASQWHNRLSGDLAFMSDSWSTIPPGQALYVNTDAPAELVIPDPTLRIGYYHQDHLSSSAVMTDAAGTLIEETSFYPFGIPRYEYRPRQTDDPYHFGQKERDQESGLHYFETRYLSAQLARFVTVDPKYANPEALAPAELARFFSNPQEMNLYAYVNNNPLRYVDPTGLGVLSWIGDKLGDAKDYVSDNLWIPGRDSLSDLDVGRTVKVGAGIGLAVVTSGASLGVEFAVAGSVIGADQVASGVLDRPSYLYQTGRAICRGNEQCGSTLEGTTLIMVGGAGATFRPAPSGPSVRPGTAPPPVVPWPETIYETGTPSPKTLPGWQPPGGAFNGTAYEVCRANASAAERAAEWSRVVNESPRDAWIQATMDATRNYRFQLPTFEQQADAFRAIVETAEQIFPIKK